jgi:hypothetical protein
MHPSSIRTVKVALIIGLTLSGIVLGCMWVDRMSAEAIAEHSRR